jgi:uncharacterized protein YifN (PemK superfamily)
MGMLSVPPAGSIVMCDFAGDVQPEMVKKRRAVVVSPWRRFTSASDATVIVVPLSEVRPDVALRWHYGISEGRYPGLKQCWAKADLVAHVSLARLNRVYHRGGWIMPMVNAVDLHAIRSAIAAAVGIT